MKKIYILIILTYSSVVFGTPVNINISSGCKYVMSSNVILSVTGNLIVSGEFYASSISTIKFCGASLQQIGGSSGVSTFQNVVFNNPANFKLIGDITINGTVTLTSGIVSTGTKTFICPSTASFSPAAGSAISFIDGRLKKTGNGSSFTFPVGDIQGDTIVWEPLQIAAYNNTNDFTVHFTYKSPYDSFPSIPTWNTGSNLAPTLYDVSGKEFWLIDRTGAGSQVPNVTLYWKDAVKSDILGNAIPNSSSTSYDTDALADLTLVHWNSGTNKWDDMGGTASGTWPTGQITNTSAFSGYSPITFGSKTGKNPLPIELLSFTATCILPTSHLGEGSGVRLYWQTASETNNNYFTIEKSTDAVNWSAIKTIAGAGNSNAVLNYLFIDTLPSHLGEGSGVRYYRLKQTDYDGVFTYSDINQTSCNENEIGIISIFPNPATNYFGFVVYSPENRDIYVKITDVLGQIIVNETKTIAKGLNNINIDVSNLCFATYYFSIETTDGEHRESKQILIK